MSDAPPTSADARPPLVDDPPDGKGHGGANGADHGATTGGRAVEQAGPNGTPTSATTAAEPAPATGARSLAGLVPPWARTGVADGAPTEADPAAEAPPGPRAGTAAAAEPAVDRPAVQSTVDEPAEPAVEAEPIEAETIEAGLPVGEAPIEAEPIEAQPVEAEPIEAELPVGGGVAGETAIQPPTVSDETVEEPTIAAAADPTAPPPARPDATRPEVAARADRSTPAEAPTPADPVTPADRSTPAEAPTPDPRPGPDTRPTAGSPSRPSGTRLTVARVLSGVGRTLIGAGLVILLFVGYQLWGTNFQEARSQNELEDDFDATLEQLDRVDPSLLSGLRGSEETSTSGATLPTTPATVPREVIELLAPQAGEAMAVIRIPKIRVERRVVQGTEVDDLRKGPGHYPESPLPGQRGNSSIAGHRTTYGAPFNRIDELVPGDEIQVQTVQGTAMYRVDKEPFVVSPTQVEVLNDVGDNRLTLTSCHPKLSARQRMIVTAQLVSEPFAELPSTDVRVQTDIASTTTIAEAIENPDDPTASTSPTTIGEEEPAITVPTTTTTISPTTTTEAEADTTEAEADTAEMAGEANLDQGLAGDRSALAPAIGWGLVAGVVALAAGLLGRAWERRAVDQPRRRRRLLIYGLVSPVFLLVLYLCFENVDRVLPAF